MLRGARSDACQQIAKGFYNMLGSMLGRNPHSNTPTPDLRIHLRIAEQKPAVEQAAMAARHRQATRDLFKVDDDFTNSPAGTIVSTVGSLATLPANFSPLGIPTTIAQTYQGWYDDYVQARERQGLPVNRDDKTPAFGRIRFKKLGVTLGAKILALQLL